MFVRQNYNDGFNLMHSDQLGAPQMNGVNGSEGQILQVLDACLINGFNLQTVSQVIDNGDGTVTLKYGTDHGYIKRQLITVSGADDAALNGKHRIISVPTTLELKISVNTSQTTGTINTKIAPLGWESIFGDGDTLKRAYRSKNTQSNQRVLYLDMSLPADHGYHATSPSKRAMVTVCEDMQQIGVPINDYTANINDYDNLPNGSLFWYQKRNYGKTDAVTSSTNNKWLMIGTDTWFIFFNGWSGYSSANGSATKDVYGFGDVPSLAGSVDTHNTFLVASVNYDDRDSVYYSTNADARVGYITDYNKTVNNKNYNYKKNGLFVKDFNGVGDVAHFCYSVDGSSDDGTYSGKGADRAPYPNPTNQGLVAMPLCMSQDGNVVRAVMPRLMFVANDLDGQESHDLTYAGDYMLVCAQGATNGNEVCYFALDLGD